ncbi:S-methyl-5-thioribose-1-phosphate isomerase [Aestuariirhabdus sp. Z084]|uniref:S-methyl-5-thioribose-1-phosphate isomerase n=1 Tax=Aestuariirhabdus haliotis TaxID=2918751 RepID=UPI00201B3CC7|nr:S-methyl-5-thioribose-1-phosphate isomerase [Aestuariirhabdus haliotis]MCL6417002.1 S-methyl-5-thioribose-1-phosphate isomerase [Aestuariirhabdus haliotis]MCL6421035.1 S-methyl-5-thioribose-1-phosphate isomerase [Aestuariirhabdus haliotis]
MTGQKQRCDAVVWEAEVLCLLDQRLLPGEERYLHYRQASGVAKAIKDMVVRGAPAIGIAAAYAVVLSLREHVDDSQWQERVATDISGLRQSRPTAVNLKWALDRMQDLIASSGSAVEACVLVEREAIAIHEVDRRNNQHMGVLGVATIRRLSGEGPHRFMTHCNAGALATGGYGTALGVIRSAWQEGVLELVHMDETRPWLQGSRLTAWELLREGIPSVLNADGASAHIIRQQKIAWIVVGADRIAANGDVANKIGTYGLAILAHHHGAKVMVVAPTSTVDMSLASGEQIPIEERAADELLSYGGELLGVEGCPVANPVFDVTPADLVDVLVTEKGVVEHPDSAKMHSLMQSGSVT